METIQDPKHAEEAEQIKQRDNKIINERNLIRYQECLDEAEAFFNTMYPIAVKHSISVLHEDKFKRDIPVLTRDFLLGYLGIWNTVLMRKYK